MTTLKRELWGSCVAIAVTAATGTAFAQAPDDSQLPPDANDPGAPVEPTTTPPTYTPPPAYPPPEAGPPPEPSQYDYESEQGYMGPMGTLKRIGLSFSLGGGVEGFTDDDMRDFTNVGGNWTARIVLGTRSPIAFEATYFGSAQSIDALGLPGDAVLVSNGVGGALRVNATTNVPVQPFIFGGLAWAHYNVTRSSQNFSDIRNNDNVLEFPVGLGVAGYWQGLTLDVRGEVRFAVDEDLVPKFGSTRADDDFASMHRWGVTATVGYNF